MNKVVPCLVLACLFVATTCRLPVQVAGAADGEKGNEDGKKRAALWQALLKALPEKYKEIDVYAENPSLSQVLFRSQGTTLTFSFIGLVVASTFYSLPFTVQPLQAAFETIGRAPLEAAAPMFRTTRS